MFLVIIERWYFLGYSKDGKFSNKVAIWFIGWNSHPNAMLLKWIWKLKLIPYIKVFFGHWLIKVYQGFSFSWDIWDRINILKTKLDRPVQPVQSLTGGLSRLAHPVRFHTNWSTIDWLPCQWPNLLPCKPTISFDVY